MQRGIGRGVDGMCGDGPKQQRESGYPRQTDEKGNGKSRLDSSRSTNDTSLRMLLKQKTSLPPVVDRKYPSFLKGSRESPPEFGPMDKAQPFRLAQHPSACRSYHRGVTLMLEENPRRRQLGGLVSGETSRANKLTHPTPTAVAERSGPLRRSGSSEMHGAARSLVADLRNPFRQ